MLLIDNFTVVALALLARNQVKSQVLVHVAFDRQQARVIDTALAWHLVEAEVAYLKESLQKFCRVRFLIQAKLLVQLLRIAILE